MAIGAGVLAWLRLARVFNKLERRSQGHLRCYGLSPAQFDVLAQLGRLGQRGEPTQQELAEALLVTKGNVTQLVERMEEAGLLTRRQEGRAKRVCLTDAGRALRERVIPAEEEFMARQLLALAPAEQKALARLLGRLDRALDDAECDAIEATYAGDEGSRMAHAAQAAQAAQSVRPER